MILLTIFVLVIGTVASKDVVTVDPRNCYDFLAVVDNFRSAIEYGPKVDYEKYVGELCKMHPMQCGNYKKVASMICQKYPVQCGKYQEMLPIVVSLLENDFDYDHICSLLYPLPGSTRPSTFPKQFSKSSPLCIGCKVVVKAVEFQVKVLNETRKAIISGIKVLCHLIPIIKIQEKICTDVTDYIDKIIQEVLAGMDPKDICVKLKLCEPTKISKDFPLGADWKKLFPGITGGFNGPVLGGFEERKAEKSSKLGSDWKNLYPGMEKKQDTKKTETSSALGADWRNLYPGMRGMYSGKKVDKSLGFGSDWKSLYPGLVGKNAKKMEKKNTGLGADLEKLFSEIFKEQKEAMRQFGEDLENTGPKFEKNLEKTMPFVGARVERFMQKVLQNLGVKPKELDSEVGCTICKTVIRYIDWEVEHVNGSIEFIIHTVKDFCKLDPIKPAKKVCDVVLKKLETILELIGEKIEPEQICKEIRFCSSTPVVQKNSLYARRDCKKVCSHMRMVSNYDLDSQLRKLSKSGDSMRELCGDSNTSKAKCINVMKLIKQVGHEAGEVMRASDERYCKCTLRPQQMLFMLLGRPSPSNDLCKMCLKFEKTMEEDLLKVNKTMLALVDAMEDICDFLSGPMKERCSTVVGDIKSFAEFLEKKMNPAGVCKAMSICPSN